MNFIKCYNVLSLTKGRRSLQARRSRKQESSRSVIPACYSKKGIRFDQSGLL